MATHPRHRRHRYVVRGVVNGRRIPGWYNVDPLTHPFAKRASTYANAFQRCAAARTAWIQAQAEGAPECELDALTAESSRWYACIERLRAL